MRGDTTIAFRRQFETLIDQRDAEEGDGDDIALAILFAALVVAKAKLGKEELLSVFLKVANDDSESYGLPS